MKMYTYGIDGKPVEKYTAMQQASEPAWIEHDGSAVCPVPAGHDVEIRNVGGMEGRHRRPTGLLWQHITHYRDWTAFEQQQAGEVPSLASTKAILDSVMCERWASARQTDVVKRLRIVQENLARYIATHEPEPVDPITQLAQEIDEEWSGGSDTVAQVVERMLRARGVTVAKEASDA